MATEILTVIEVLVDGDLVDRRIVDRREQLTPATPANAQPEKLRITDAPEPSAAQVPAATARRPGAVVSSSTAAPPHPPARIRVGESPREPGGFAPTPPAGRGQPRADTGRGSAAPTSSPATAVDLALLREVEAAREWDELWEGFDGLSAEQICNIPQLRAETQRLQLMGVRDPIGVVLKHGPPRIAQCRGWVEQKRRTQKVSNPAGLLMSFISKHSADWHKNKGEIA